MNNEYKDIKQQIDSTSIKSQKIMITPLFVDTMLEKFIDTEELYVTNPLFGKCFMSRINNNEDN